MNGGAKWQGQAKGFQLDLSKRYPNPVATLTAMACISSSTQRAASAGFSVIAFLESAGTWGWAHTQSSRCQMRGKPLILPDD
jgi:hypothetical protein